MTSINKSSPLFNDNELNKILQEMNVNVKEKARPDPARLDTSPAATLDEQKTNPDPSDSPSESYREEQDARSIEEILRENSKIN